jgi:hypothetical protein
MKHRESASARDPIEWAIIAVIISGSSLCLSLEAKIEARRRAQSAAAAEKAKNGNLLRLRTIRGHINEMRSFVSLIPKLGQFQVDKGKPPLISASIVFGSPQDEEQFNQHFDRVAAVIGRINRCLSEIDVEGVPLSEEDTRNFVTEPIRRLQEKITPLLQMNGDPHKRIGSGLELLKEYSDLLEKLENALGNAKGP